MFYKKAVKSNLRETGHALFNLTGWGILNWDYFQNDPKKADEGWFSESAKNGGVDKLGHFYFSYEDAVMNFLGSPLYSNPLYLY